MPTLYKVLEHGPETVVKVTLKSWTHPVDAEAGPARVELQLGTADESIDMSAEITPAQARAVAKALIEVADIAENASPVS